MLIKYCIQSTTLHSKGKWQFTSNPMAGCIQGDLTKRNKREIREYSVKAILFFVNLALAQYLLSLDLANVREHWGRPTNCLSEAPKARASQVTQLLLTLPNT